ncbi:putative late blight resistance protein homolog r1a-6 [Phtheirospermum japonicum]|uniref:Putative late blight resistance protein homolog r1a-6 n=1 Tax=Phtheirospermum japonicum TaxID=374723 RepID=A0A830B4E8_9LAMI|nr:putative late blight resistance protein homolog r1a-6 [Phtheirospermum japonicum]
MVYTAVFSLVQSLDQLLSFDHLSDSHYDKSPIFSLRKKVSSLQSSLGETFPLPESMLQAVDDLETKIRDVIHKAQHTIDSFMCRQQISEDDRLRFTQDLRNLTASIDRITEKAKQTARSAKSHRRSSRFDDVSEPPTLSIETKEIVGHERNLELLKGMLLTKDSRLQTAQIIGMPAIGKSTLAKCIYDSLSIQSRFDTRAWVTVRTEYRDKFIFVTLVVVREHREERDDVKVLTFKVKYHASYETPITELGQLFFKTKYLVVIDDVRDHEVWFKIRMSLPDSWIGNRVIVTTRNPEFARWTLDSDHVLKDPFLNDDESWRLLQSVVFAGHGEACDPQLEKIGKKIAKNCEGLPLAIIEVGKLLRGADKTVEEWKAVEEREHPVIIGADEDTPLSRTLCLSYKQLPPHLKACFLYMGLLPKNTEIRKSKLIKLWVAEGFSEEDWINSSEKNAEKYLEELVSKSLVLVRKQSSGGGTKTCGVHVVYRSLCMSEARKEKFFHIMSKLSADSSPTGATNSQRHRLCFHNNVVLGFKQVHESLGSVSAARSLLCFGPHHQYPIQVHYSTFKLLRVLESLALRFYEFPYQVLELVWLKYLAITYDGELPPSISNLCDLEVLIVHHHRIIKSADASVIRYLPIEIWKLRRLRHLHCMGSDLRDPSDAARGDYSYGSNRPFVLHELTTLSGVSAHSFTKKILERMPKLTRVGIRIESAPDHAVETFSFFNELASVYGRFESFKCVVVDRGLVDFPSVDFEFPIFLKKLSLSGCGFSWGCIACIVGLPNLEVLKLRCNAVQGPVWKKDGFRKWESLEFLLLEDLDVEHWGVAEGYFPKLKRVVIRHCYKLRGIDDELGEIPKLEMIEVDDCSPGIEAQAREIGNKRLSRSGNGGGVRVVIHSSRDDEKKRRS